MMEMREPITHSETRALLEPLATSLHCIEKTLIELLSAPRSFPEGKNTQEVLSQENVEAQAKDASAGFQPASEAVTSLTTASCLRGVISKDPDLLGNDQDHRVAGLLAQDSWKTQNQSGAFMASPPQGESNEEELTPTAMHVKGCTNAEVIPSMSEDVSNEAAVTHQLSKINQDSKATKQDKQNQLFDVVAYKNIEGVFKSKANAKSKMVYLDRLVNVVRRCFLWCTAIKEPERHGHIAKLVKSRFFKALVTLAIVLNAGVGAYLTNWEMRNIGKTQHPIALPIELVFSIFFLIEIALRLAVHRFYFFVGKDMKWHLFDVLVVTSSAFDLLFRHDVGKNKDYMRVLRIAKLTRILRSLRAFKFIKSLNNLLECIGNSLTSLFWGCIMLNFILYLFSLLFMQGLIEYLGGHRGQDLDPKVHEEIMSSFGSLGATLVSLYMSVTGGDDWKASYSMIARAGVMYSFLFCLFTFVFIFALCNILTGSIIDQAMYASQSDRNDLILDQHKRSTELRQRLMEICKAIDIDKDGQITWKEFEERMSHPVLIDYMASIGIEIHEFELFFACVSARASHIGVQSIGGVALAQFVEGCMHMKGSATAIDMQRQLFEMHILQHTMKDLKGLFSQRITELEDMVRQSLHARKNLARKLEL